MVRTLTRPERLHDVTLRPVATAKVLLAVGLPLETVAVPGVPLGRGDVLVALELSTICRDDLHVVRGVQPAPLPLVLGHESVGRVIALGESGACSVDGSELRIGDRVVWSQAIPCGTCDRCLGGGGDCRAFGQYGRERIGPRWELTGGFASHVHLRAGTALVRVPESLPAATLAPASCATANAWAAVTRAAVGRDLERTGVLVLGAGLTGLSAAAIAAELGAATVTVADASAIRRELAGRFGATHTAAPGAAAVGSRASTATGDPAGRDAAGKPAGPSDTPPHAADIVVDTTGHGASDALAAAAPDGTVVLVGTDPAAEPVPMDAAAVVRRGLRLLGIRSATGHELASAVAFLAGRGRAYPFADLVGAVHPLDDIDAALAAAGAADAPLRVGIAPR